ncbi:MAG: dienelactone hydrolase family protein [Opitutaceae bacterium]|nr:dienelactone hydrolase family protein [Opitutaceae bacterium]
MCGQSARTESFLGNLAPIVNSIHAERGFPLAFEHRGALSVGEWRRQGRAEIERTLSYAPKDVPLDVRVDEVLQRPGYEIRRISFAGSPHYRVPAFLLVPTTGKGPYPAVVALHDHGGWYFHGKEKLVWIEGEHAALKDYRARYYGARTFADELAKRGFVVIVPDAFYWGERRLQYEQPPAALTERLNGLRPETYDFVKATNRYLDERVHDLNTCLAFAGTSWMGIVNHDDRRSVSVLAAMPEVDPQRLGCIGLSGGGYRATYLTGTEPRMRAAAIVGWMTSLPSTLAITYETHAGLFDAFGLHASLDHPDIASLAAPDTAVLVQNCSRDRLFTRAGMEDSSIKIQKVYQALGHPEKYRFKFYDVPHRFDAEMQDDAFAWLEQWLNRPATGK